MVGIEYKVTVSPNRFHIRKSTVSFFAENTRVFVFARNHNLDYIFGLYNFAVFANLNIICRN